MHDYTTTEGRVAALAEIQELLTTYSAKTFRPAFADAILLDILTDREADFGSGADYTTASALHALRTIIDAGKGLSIDGHFWDAMSDQTSDLLAEHGLAADPADDFDD